MDQGSTITTITPIPTMKDNGIAIENKEKDYILPIKVYMKDIGSIIKSMEKVLSN